MQPCSSFDPQKCLWHPQLFWHLKRLTVIVLTGHTHTHTYKPTLLKTTDPPCYAIAAWENWNIRDVKLTARRSASEYSRFRTRPSFGPYLAPVKISWWFLKRFESYRIFSKQTRPQTLGPSENNITFATLSLRGW